MSLNPWRRWC